MKTKAVRLYGKFDLRTEEFELPELGPGDVLIKIISDGACMSTYKTVRQGAAHLRVPDDVDRNPVIVGHEFCAEVVEVGEKQRGKFAPGDKVVMPPVLKYLGGNETIGYSFRNIGGLSTYSLVSEHMIEHGHLIKLTGDAFFRGSLVEPASCVVRGFKASYHLDGLGEPVGGIKPGGKMAILAGCGPMGLAAIDIALHRDVRPSLLVITDIDEARLARAKELFPPEKAARETGVKLVFGAFSSAEELMDLSDGKGYDDVFVYAPVPAVVELGDAILAFDGCLNFFAGPTDKTFGAHFNFYNVHYAQHHVAGTSGSTVADMGDVVDLLGRGKIDPAVMITHIGGLDAAVDTTIHLPEIPGGKKLIYTHIELPLTAIADFGKLGAADSRFARLAELVKKNNGLWNAEAEKYLLDAFAKK